MLGEVSHKKRLLCRWELKSGSVKQNKSLDYNNKTIILLVYEGLYKLYMYKSKAYKRNDSSTIEMDILELHRIILEGKNLSFEQLDVDEEQIINYLSDCIHASSSDIAKSCGYTKDKTLRLLKLLQSKGYVKVSGNGKVTKYSIKILNYLINN